MDPSTANNPEYQKLLRQLEQAGLAEELIKKGVDWRDLGSPHTETWLKRFITQDEELLRLKEDVKKLAAVEDCVLILGESGTGKELIANALHGGRTGKFIPINCTSLPDYLLESELFGHAKGSFTGALESKEGILEAAKGGTVFLDEIGDMPLTMQAKLLRTIQFRKIRRVGENVERDINCRFVAATNRKLGESGFRKDLYYRLSTFELKIKPLRERRDDIDLIAANIDKIFPLNLVKYNHPTIGTCMLADDIVKGNVRGLESLIKRWQVLKRI